MSANVTSSKNNSDSNFVDWAQSYPRSEYPKSHRSITYTLHFLIALNQPEDVINNYITSLDNKKSFTKLFARDEDTHNLTPLMIAVMKTKSHVVSKLLAVAKSQNWTLQELSRVDNFGWTPLHHAALSSEAIFEDLINHGAPIHLKNKANGTPMDIKNLVSFIVPSTSASKTTVFMDNNQTILVSKIAPENLKSILGITEYRDCNYYPKSEYKYLWTAPNPQLYSHTSLHEVWVENPPRLGIRPCKELMHISELSKELIAMEDLPLGCQIGAYPGEVDHNLQRTKVKTFAQTFNQYSKEAAYNRTTLFSHERSNALIYANFGFPNLIPLEVIAGGNKIGMFVSGGISKGDPLLWDYGPGMTWLSYGKTHLFDKNHMRSFFRKGIDAITAEIHAKETSNPIISILTRCRLLFPLSAPAAILDLHFNNLISASEWKGSLVKDKNPFILEWIKQQPFATTYLRCFLKCILDLEAAIGSNNELRALLNPWVIEKNNELSIMQMVKVFENIKEELKKNSQTDWTSFLKQQETLIENYDWNHDPNPAIGYEGSKRVMFECYEGMTQLQRVTTLTYNLNMLRTNDGSEESESLKLVRCLAEKYIPGFNKGSS